MIGRSLVEDDFFRFISRLASFMAIAGWNGLAISPGMLGTVYHVSGFIYAKDFVI
jgi:hypothetical protein